MARTSKALRRLGVAGVSAATIASGLVILAPSAFAADTATSVALSPKSDTAAIGTCNQYVATVAPADGTATIHLQVTQTLKDQGTGVTPGDIGFCDPTAPSGTTESDANATTSTPTTQKTTATDNGVNDYDTKNGTITFGVYSNQPGSMTVTAWSDQEAVSNNAPNVGEPQDSASKTWVSGAATAITSVSCTPTSATNPSATTHNFTCTAFNGSTPVNNAPIYFRIPSGPDQTATDTMCVDNGDNDGKETCSYTNNGGTGTDSIYVFVEQNSPPNGPQSSEPNTTISKTWVNAAPNTSTVELSCAGATTSAAGAATQECQDPTSDKTEVFTATVKNGTTKVSGVIVNFTITGDNGAGLVPPDPASDTETLNPTSCTTDANGQCSTTLTNNVPTEGERIQVTASVPRQGAGDATDNAGKTWHDAANAEARNITVTPDGASNQQTHIQAFTATVKDRFGGPVSGVVVQFSESGPGRFTNGSSQTSCTTNASGQCSVETTSTSDESGKETVTGTIYYGAAPGTAPTALSECSQAAGTTGFTGSAPTAGNCSDNGDVTWTAVPSGNAPTITYSQPNKTAGQNVTFSGTSSDTVTISISNATTGGFKTLTTITPTNGQWSYTTPISYNSTVKATNSAGSAQVTVNVNVKVTIDAIRFLGKDARGKCVTRFLGGTFPFIPGAPVWIRNSAVTPTQPIGYSTVFQFGGSGRYDVRFGLQCGRTYRLFSLISGTGADGTKYTDNGVGTDRTYVAGT